MTGHDDQRAAGSIPAIAGASYDSNRVTSKAS
jgi:hypothetical protein